MSDTNAIRLDDRAVMRVGGDDARTLLQGLLTCDVTDLAPGESTHGALLTPQGKILFEAIVHCIDADTFAFDTARDLAPEFLKRLMFYKLRANVTLEIADDLSVVCTPGGAMDGMGTDPRLAQLGARGIANQADVAGFSNDADAYHALRVCAGVAELGHDYQSGEVFPHDVNHDQLAGVDFAKGCFVGQEVVSRMQHRGTARKRFVPVHIEGPAPEAGTDITAGGKSIGTMGSSAGDTGLALVRLDRLQDAVNAGQDVICGNASLVASKPDWASFSVADASQPAA